MPRHSGIIIDVKSRTPSVDDRCSAAAVPGRNAATNEEASLRPVPGTGPGEAVQHNLTGEDNEEDAAGSKMHQQQHEDVDDDVEADSEHEGRPPQLRIVEPRQLYSNLILQRWVKVRAQLRTVEYLIWTEFDVSIKCA